MKTSLVAFSITLIFIISIILIPTLLNQDQVKIPLSYDRYVFIGDDELTITVVSIIMSRLKKYSPVLNITHYPDFRAISPRSLYGVGWIMFSGDYLSKVLGDEELREAFARFLREVHLARGGRGAYVAFGNNSHLLFYALCLAGIHFNEATCARYRNPFLNSRSPLIVEVVFEDHRMSETMIGIVHEWLTLEDIANHVVDYIVPKLPSSPWITPPPPLPTLAPVPTPPASKSK